MWGALRPVRLQDDLLLQVQEQQRIIQEQRRIIENLRSKVSELEIAQKQSIITEAKTENTVNNGKRFFGTKIWTVMGMEMQSSKNISAKIREKGGLLTVLTAMIPLI